MDCSYAVTEAHPVKAVISLWWMELIIKGNEKEKGKRQKEKGGKRRKHKKRRRRKDQCLKVLSLPSLFEHT